jgi:hypothetical protein
MGAQNPNNDYLSKQLKIGMAGFFIAMLGVVFGLIIDYGPEEPLSLVAFGVVGLGVLIGFFSIAWGWFAIYKHHHKK